MRPDRRPPRRRNRRRRAACTPADQIDGIAIRAVQAVPVAAAWSSEGELWAAGVRLSVATEPGRALFAGDALRARGEIVDRQFADVFHAARDLTLRGRAVQRAPAGPPWRRRPGREHVVASGRLQGGERCRRTRGDDRRDLREAGVARVGVQVRERRRPRQSRGHRLFFDLTGLRQADVQVKRPVRATGRETVTPGVSVGVRERINIGGDLRRELDRPATRRGRAATSNEHQNRPKAASHPPPAHGSLYPPGGGQSTAPHGEIGVKRILGVLSLARKHGAPTVDDAAKTAISWGRPATASCAATSKPGGRAAVPAPGRSRSTSCPCTKTSSPRRQEIRHEPRRLDHALSQAASVRAGRRPRDAVTRKTRRRSPSTSSHPCGDELTRQDRFFGRRLRQAAFRHPGHH